MTLTFLFKLHRVFLSSKYADVHRKLGLIAEINKLTNDAIEILENEVKKSEDETRARSAYLTLMQIYMSQAAIDKKWLPLFKETFEVFIGDRTINNHLAKFLKYLKLLNRMKEYELVLKHSLDCLNIYPKEYIPLDMICRIYTETLNQSDFSFDVSFDSINLYSSFSL